MGEQKLNVEKRLPRKLITVAKNSFQELWIHQTNQGEQGTRSPQEQCQTSGKTPGTWKQEQILLRRSGGITSSSCADIDNEFNDNFGVLWKSKINSNQKGNLKNGVEYSRYFQKAKVFETHLVKINTPKLGRLQQLWMKKYK